MVRAGFREDGFAQNVIPNERVIVMAIRADTDWVARRARTMGAA